MWAWLPPSGAAVTIKGNVRKPSDPVASSTPSAIRRREWLPKQWAQGETNSTSMSKNSTGLRPR
ncbi:hypothetical protein EMGR_000577 [Emarellia grisea]